MRKTLIITALALFSLQAAAGSYVPREGEVKFTILQTSGKQPLHEVKSTPFTIHPYPMLRAIDLDAEHPSHKYFGCGISMTDASCWLLSQMDPESRRELLKKAFNPYGAEDGGVNFSIIRLNCGASDYATELYNYDDTPGDVAMKDFSIDRDRLYMIPMLKEVLTQREDMYVFSSIWSAPGWMKSSGTMCGGSLLDEHLPSFANYWAAYLKAYRDAGIGIDAITVQNEPLTDQHGGCPATLISASQEAQLVGRYLPESFRKAGVKADVWIHDHNYKQYQRVLDILGDKAARKHTAAVAWHPYSGEAKQIEAVHREYPDMPFHLTERGGTLSKKSTQTAKWFCDLIFGALNAGCSSYCAWNLLLDEDGQPNTGRFDCMGLVERDNASGKLSYSTQWQVFRQFSPYVRRGAEILEIESPDPGLTTIVFRNPDGRHVIVVAAEGSNTRQRVQIKYRDKYMALCLPISTWSMSTILID